MVTFQLLGSVQKSKRNHVRLCFFSRKRHGIPNITISKMCTSRKYKNDAIQVAGTGFFSLLCFKQIETPKFCTCRISIKPRCSGNPWHTRGFDNRWEVLTLHKPLSPELKYFIQKPRKYLSELKAGRINF